MRNAFIALAVVALVPGYAAAQVAHTQSAVTVGGKTAPSGTDTPTAPIPGTVAPPPANVDLPLPSIDSSGANRSNSSSTGEVAPPIGAPRLPGEPLNPPSGPNN